VASLSPGRIFWQVYPGERGAGKSRPMIVATRRSDILRTGQVIAVVCSTDFGEPLDSREVLLPSGTGPRCITRLPRPTVAVRDWIAELPVGSIRDEDLAGFVPAALLREILTRAGLEFTPER